MNGHSPIGVFDSGIGGLSVARELRALLPREDILYYADSAFCPYGVRPEAEIEGRVLAIAGWLVGRGAKAIVVACNTASSVALEAVRERYGGFCPIVGLEPAVRPAVAMTQTGKIAVLATPRTAAGERLARLVRLHAGATRVTTVAAPGLADLVEAGETDGDAVLALLDPLLRPLVAAGVDTLVLGCTHYPFVAGAIQSLIGPEVAIVESGEAVARRTRDVLALRGGLRSGTGLGALVLATSGDDVGVRRMAFRLLGTPVVAPPGATIQAPGMATDAGTANEAIPAAVC
ncbi:MAG: Glutamate racemase [uncultured Thermomicrobiales bacterium]|uniref:Glutamate racemase n=1 Tax=uncultured Thermomicrobiales bacterium TaxID=1645740 RepID=A0A6J4UTP4_9BACT|nr:MAG: Glutamate racemase [uncultured Thermomicrobiales bacterium]